MFNTRVHKDNFRLTLIIALLTGALVLVVPVSRAKSPEVSQNQQESATTPDDEAAGTDSVVEPKMKDYKGVTIGMSAEMTREKLGKPANKGEKQDFYLISDDEIAQVYYNPEGKVRAVVVTYTGKAAAALTPMQVLGEDVPPGSDGRVYKLVRYPSVGYWVAYARTASDKPVVSMTIQRIRSVKP